jgi:CheY-like chemotaxis protein
VTASARILVVDDDEGILGFVTEALAEEGYEVLAARDGAEALEQASREPPDLILLDMRMPVMDGWQFTAAYRSRPGPHAPIIVMTAARDAPGIANEIHAQGCLPKPFTLTDLLDVAARFTRQKAEAV